VAETATLRGDASVIAEYKKILKQVLDIRPSGTRQRLAVALGKNRSFISQIANPAYPMPIPATHLDTVFEICRFSDSEKRKFIDLYQQAHPGRFRLVSSRTATSPIYRKHISIQFLKFVVFRIRKSGNLSIYINKPIQGVFGS